MHWFGNLIVGARATILTEITPQNILEAVHNERGTIVWLLVPWAQDILDALDRGELRKEDYDLNSWRLMHIGAQPVPPVAHRVSVDHRPLRRSQLGHGWAGLPCLVSQQASLPPLYPIERNRHAGSDLELPVFVE